MNSYPDVPASGPSAAARAGKARRLPLVGPLSTAALLSAAAPLAAVVVALGPAPLATAMPVAAPASSQHPGVTANGVDPCFGSSFSTAHTMKIPNCAGD